MRFYFPVLRVLLFFFSFVTALANSAPDSSGIPANFVFVEGGSFLMGSDSLYADEIPQHRVTLDSFWIGKYEVTQKEWADIMGENPSSSQGDSLAIDNVSWADVQVFIQKLNQKTGLQFSLPTEAEWEFASRGGNASKGFLYSGSDELNDVGWYRFNSSRKKHNVGAKLPNELGIYDMSGGVWEWCSDWYDSSYYAVSPIENPKGPIQGTYRVARGGSWSSGTVVCRVSSRGFDSPERGDYQTGFRLVVRMRSLDRGQRENLDSGFGTRETEACGLEAGNERCISFIIFR